MKNEIHPFHINISISDAIEYGIISIGKCNIVVTHTNGKIYTLIEIFNSAESLCMVNNCHTVYRNTQLFISEKVVRYSEIICLKFVEQTKLFEDGNAE